MSKKILITILIISILGLLTIGGVYAGNFIKNRDKNLPPFYFKRLNLSDEQKEKIKEIFNNLKDESDKIFEEIKNLTEKEKDIISNDVLNENELNVVVESQIKNILDLLKLKENGYLKILEILNDEQRKIFPTFIEFARAKPFIFNLDFVKEKVNEFNMRIRNYLRLGKKLNLSEEQKNKLKELIQEENKNKMKFIHSAEFRFLVRKLNLSDEQVEKLRKLFEEERDKEKEIFEKIKDNNYKQREILKSESFNEEKLKNLIDEYILYESEILSLRKNLYFNYLKILNLEQRKKSPTSIFFFKLI
ncbi:MAG: hypothetical protein H5U37_01235 [Caldisericia bacterium]|nr:hypothetical protein [Caldisericia bacterium]